jgi:hypothetical protein
MTSRIFVIAGIAFAAGVPLFAQEELHHHNFIIGGGAAIPVGNTTNFLSTAPTFKVGYGYRFLRWFQADAGLQIAFGAANNQNAEVSDFGPVQGGDHEFMLPLGGRFIAPVLFKKIEVSAGGGAAYLHYAETIPSGGDVAIGCYSCTSRGGWGGYGLGNARYFLDENHNFSVGTTLQYITASTNGQAVGNVPSVRTTDHWVNLTFEFGLSF